MIANAVMHKPSGPPLSSGWLQRKCATCGGCRACAAPQPRTLSAQPTGSGRALDAALASDLGARFGHDFSRVRVHTDSAAAASANSMGALAYTSGANVVFGTGRFAPHTAHGRRLLAHELAHVVQQASGAGRAQTPMAVSVPGDASERQADAAADAVMGARVMPRLDALPALVARACGPAALGAPTPDCAPGTTVAVIGQQFLFGVDCDDLKAVEVTPGVFRTGSAAVADFIRTIPVGSTINVHGFASADGPSAYNMDLSCHRANKVAGLLRAAGLSVRQTFKYGGVALPQSPDFWRSVIVEVLRPAPIPQNVCGPDVSDWLVDQVALAKRDSAVLAVQSDLSHADRIASTLALSGQRIAEGGAGAAVLVEARRRSPASTPAFPEPSGQLAAATPGIAELGRVATQAAVDPVGGAVAAAAVALIGRASLGWKALVGTGQRYDFKNNVLRAPSSPHCPVSCTHSVTLCPSLRGACFNTDVPGNLFYAHLGRFVGFTELALQLGSQWAQLSSTAHWDPPEDSAMISAGFGMAHPLGRSTLCTTVDAIRGSISGRACMPCAETGVIPFQ